MPLLISVIFCLLFPPQIFAQSVEEVRLTTSKGAELVMKVHYPGGKSNKPNPAVIIGSGRGYHMDLPLIKTFAEKIAGKGYVAIRFNWTYFNKKDGDASKDLSTELRDYKTVVDYAKNNPKFDTSKIFAAGKSLGSVVSYRYFKKDPEIKALFLLTPICSDHFDDKGEELPEPIKSGHRHYPGLLKDKRPVVIALGNRDPNCLLPMFYDFIKEAPSSLASVVLEGDHSLDIGGWNDPAYKKRNKENVQAVSNMLSHWMSLLVNQLGGD